MLYEISKWVYISTALIVLVLGIILYLSNPVIFFAVLMAIGFSAMVTLCYFLIET